MTSFRPTCTTCWTLRPVGSVRCADCGTRLLDPLPPPPPNLTRERCEPEPVTRLEEKSGTRYIVREVEGWRINLPIGARGGGPSNIEVAVLDTLWNHRRVYSTHSEDSYGNHQERRVRARALAFARCDELNRAHEEAVAAA